MLPSLAISAIACLSTCVFVVSARPTNLFDIALVKAEFTNALIVPGIIPAFDPKTLLHVSYPNPVGNIKTGLALQEQTLVATKPNFTVFGSQDDFSEGGSLDPSNKYALIMIDGNYTGAPTPVFEVLHYLQYDLTLEEIGYGAATFVNITEPTMPYLRPEPTPGTGGHRYIQLLYSQPANFTPVAGVPTLVQGFPLVVGFPDFIKASGLIGPLAANYFTVQNGTTVTVQVAPTTPVDVATLVLPTATQRYNLG